MAGRLEAGGRTGLRVRDRDLDRAMVRLEKKMTKDDFSKNGLM